MLIASSVVYLCSIFCAYIIGGLPLGYWYAKYYYGIDVTAHGSGNIGATNVARVLGSKWHFFLIFIGDFLKAFSVLLIAQFLSVSMLHQLSVDYFLLAIACVLLLGNAFSPFLQFRGGKGVATTVGILAAIAPSSLLLIFLLVWGMIFALGRRVDLASISAMGITALSSAVIAQNFLATSFFLFLFCFSLVRHKENLKKYLHQVKQH